MTYLATDDDTALASEFAQMGEADLAKAEPGLKELGLHDAYTAAVSAVQEARSAGAKAQNEIRSAAENLDIAEAGRADRQRKAYEAGTTAIDEHAKATAAIVDTARTKLTAACTPQEPTNAAERAELRSEVRMVLDAAKDAEDAVLSLLIGPDRGVAAVVAGSYGKRWLASRGVKVDADMQKAMDAALVAGAAAHGTPEEKRAAAALGRGGAIESLQKGIGVSLGGAKTFLGK